LLFDHTDKACFKRVARSGSGAATDALPEGAADVFLFLERQIIGCQPVLIILFLVLLASCILVSHASFKITMGNQIEGLRVDYRADRHQQNEYDKPCLKLFVALMLVHLFRHPLQITSMKR
ncbi:MAG: hypothetical protein P8P36_09680, partial [Akkermansiaceae bacterium]|nr:hypothetical protein [Akkermansiaceae bacterium]